MQARVARRIPRLITVSDSSAADIARDYRVGRDRIDVIPPGVDPVVFRPPDEVLAPRVPGRILAVSSSESPLKGLRVLLEAVAKLRTDGDIELVVIGRFTADGPIAAAIGDLGLRDTVRFVRGVSDSHLVQLLGSAQVAVVPSFYEGFSLPAVEAMACATPLVVAGGGALPEVVGSDGACARIVAPGDAQALAHEIAALLGDAAARDAMGRAGRARVTTRFGWRMAAERTVAVYRRVMARGGRAC
jgi:glycosyltransferase involved in cell wall biosynthesis